MEQLQELIRIADEKHDGHFTLMKFTTNWRCSFGTIGWGRSVNQMASGKTMEQAIENCILTDKAKED